MDISSDTGGSTAEKTTSRPQHSLGRLRSRVEDLYRWWIGELLAMVPTGWRLWPAPKLRVEASSDELVVFNLPQTAPIDRIALHEPSGHASRQGLPLSRCELVLGSDLALITPITLPDAAEANLRDVIGFSMDRYTPFREEEVRYDVRLIRRDRSSNKLDLMLYVVPRATLERLNGHLLAIGLKPVTVDVIDNQQGSAGRAGVNLLPSVSAPAQAMRARVNGALAITGMFMLIMVLAIPLYQRHQAMRSLEQELDALRTPVREAERRREDVNRRSETLRTIIERRNAAPSTLELLRELTRLTPNEAWAGQLEIKNGRVRVTGEAAAGSELMQSLTTSGYFTDPRFEAPLTQNPKSGRERFVISLAIKERHDAP